MKKLEKSDVIIGILVFLIIVLIVVSIVVVIIKKNSNNENSEEKNCEVKNNIVVTCTKKVDDQSFFTYVLNADNTGELTNYEVRFSYTYDEAQYMSIKENYQENSSGMEFNDENHEVVTINKYDSILDGDGNALHMWYKDYMKSLTEQEYSCTEEK